MHRISYEAAYLLQELNPALLDGIDLPVRIDHTFVSEIEIQISWTKILSAPIIVKLST